MAGRCINEGIGKYIAEQAINQMIASGSCIMGAKINVLGLTFKQDCADLWSSKLVNIINGLSLMSFF